MRSKVLSKSQIWLFGLAALPMIQAIHMPAGPLLANHYAKTTAVTLSALAFAGLIPRLLDGFSDPLIGYLSDRTRGRWGQHKPWMFVGSILCMISVWFFLNPTSDSGAFYYGAWYVLLTLGWTMFEIPYASWGAAMSDDYHTRTRIFYVRQLLGQIGGSAILALPMLPFFVSHEFDQAVFSAASIILITTIGVCTTITLLTVPSIDTLEKRPVASLAEAVRAVRTNPPFRLLIAATASWFFAAGMFSAPFVLFLDTHMEFGDRISLIYTTMGIAGIATMPIWPWLMSRYAKSPVWAVAIGLEGLVLSSMALIPQGDSAFAVVFALSVVNGILGSAGVIAPLAVLADIVDYGRWRTGSAVIGVYIAIYVLVYKVSIGIGYSGAFYILGWFGYEAGVENSDWAVLGLYLTLSFIPVVFATTAAIMIWKFPIGPKQLDVIQRRLRGRSVQTLMESSD